MTDREAIARLTAMVEELADELDAEIGARYPNREAYPNEMRAYQREAEPVQRAQQLLILIAGRD